MADEAHMHDPNHHRPAMRPGQGGGTYGQGDTAPASQRSRVETTRAGEGPDQHERKRAAEAARANKSD